MIYGAHRSGSNGGTLRPAASCLTHPKGRVTEPSGDRDGLGMFTNRRTVRIEWGHCDPAGIVFYPRYFEMFDHSTVLLIERAVGMNKHQLYRTYDFDGYPVVETRARFLLPTRYGDDVIIETSITEVRRSSFHLQHRLTREGALAVEGFESRVWVVRDADKPGRLKPQPLPPDIVAQLTSA